MISQAHSGRLVAVNGIEGDILALNLHSAAGILIDRAVVGGRPAQEYLARRRGNTFAGFDYCQSVILVLVVVRYRSGAQANVVLHLMGDALEYGIDSGVGIKGLVQVHRVAVHVHPLQKRIAGTGNSGNSLGILVAVNRLRARWDVCRVRSLGSVDINYQRYRNLRLDPIGVKGHVVGRHGLAGKVVGHCSVRDLLNRHSVPALEMSLCRKARRFVGSDILIGQRGAVFDVFLSRDAVIVQYQIITEAVVVQKHIAFGRVPPPKTVIAIDGCRLCSHGLHAGNALLSPIAAFTVGILGVNGTLVVVLSVILYAVIAVCGTRLVEALKHVVEVIQAIRTIVCRSCFAVTRTQIRRHGNALGR